MPADRLNDQICAEDILSSQKFLMSNYNTAIYESANPDLRRDLMEIYRQEQDGAMTAFNTMNKKGWYTPKAADPQMISEARNKTQQHTSHIR